MKKEEEGVGKVCTVHGPVCVRECHLLQGNETETELGLQQKVM